VGKKTSHVAAPPLGYLGKRIKKEGNIQNIKTKTYHF
jgi:hypothetical protein